MQIQLPFAVRPLNLGTIATGNAKANRPVSHLNERDQIGMVWESSGNTNVWARGDMGSAKPIDFIAMVAANALPGTTIRVRLGTTQAHVDGSSAPYDSGVLAFIDPAVSRESGLYHSHLELSAVVNARWWRIDIGGHTGDFQASGLVIGEKITPTRFYDRDFEFGHEDLGELTISRNGVVDAVDGIVLRRLLFKLSWLTEAEYFTKFEPMIAALATRGISYWCFDPAPSAYRQQKTYMGFFGTPPFARGVAKPKTFEKEFQIRSLI